MQFFTLPDNIAEDLRSQISKSQSNRPILDVSREVNFYLGDGTHRSAVLVVDGKYYAMNPDEHEYFEPTDIGWAELSEAE